MLTVGFMVVGALLGAVTARRRGGNGLDIAQYAAGYGLAFGLVGFFVSIYIARG